MRRETKFRDFLVQDKDIQSKVKSVNSKVAKALIVEREMNVELDDVVTNDDKMYRLLTKVQTELNDKEYHGVYQNAVRKYYLFINGKEFPTLKRYKGGFGR
jgi:hypothetical protein